MVSSHGHFSSSYLARRPTAFVKGAQRWLQTRLQIHAEDVGDVLHHGNQNDSFNCGIVAINTIAHNILDVDLWTPEKAVRERAEWFLKLAYTQPLQIDTVPCEEPQIEASTTQVPKRNRMTIAELLNSDESDSSMGDNDFPDANDLPILTDLTDSSDMNSSSMVLITLDDDSSDNWVGASDVGEYVMASVCLGKRLDRSSSAEASASDAESASEITSPKRVSKKPKALTL